MSLTLKIRQNRPRDSLLDLFDPLRDEPATPPRETMALSDSDKENNTPVQTTRLLDEDLTMSAFFNRKKIPLKHSDTRPVVLKKRLVDVGDATFADASLIAESSSDEEDLVLPKGRFRDLIDSSFSSDQTMHQTPRKPLQDLLLETPAVASSPTKQTGKRQRHSLAAIPVVNSPLSSVINAQSSLPPHEAPHIVITDANSSILSASLSDLRLGESTTSPLADITFHGESRISREAIRHTPSARSLNPADILNNANRMSLDLQASFNFQMQSAESSFDLLNDRVSFMEMISSGGGDDSFDMELDVENLREAWSSIPPTQDISFCDTMVAKTPKAAVFQDSVTSVNDPQTPLGQCAPQTCPSPAPTPDFARLPSPPSQSPEVLSSPISSPSCPPSQLQPPSAIPVTSALRIVKRSTTRLATPAATAPKHTTPSPPVSSVALSSQARMAIPRSGMRAIAGSAPTITSSNSRISSSTKSAAIQATRATSAGPCPPALLNNSKNTGPRTGATVTQPPSSKIGINGNGKGLKAPTKYGGVTFGKPAVSSNSTAGVKVGGSENVRLRSATGAAGSSRIGSALRKAT